MSRLADSIREARIEMEKFAMSAAKANGALAGDGGGGGGGGAAGAPGPPVTINFNTALDPNGNQILAPHWQDPLKNPNGNLVKDPRWQNPLGNPNGNLIPKPGWVDKINDPNGNLLKSLNLVNLSINRLLSGSMDARTGMKG